MRSGFYDNPPSGRPACSFPSERTPLPVPVPPVVDAELEIAAPPNLGSLPNSAMTRIWHNLLSVDDILALRAVSKALKDSSEESGIWNMLCERRWGGGPDGVQHHLSTIERLRQGVTITKDARHRNIYNPADYERYSNYKRLFSERNGWRSRPLERSRPASTGEVSQCMNLPDRTMISAGIDRNFSISLYRHDPLACPPDDSPPDSYRGGKLPWSSSQAPEPCSLEIIDPETGTVAYGNSGGGVFFVKLTETRELMGLAHPLSTQDLACDLLAAFHPPPESNQLYPVTGIQYCRGSKRLVGLWERGESAQFWRPEINGGVRVLDVETFNQLGEAHESVEKHELCCITPLDTIGNELVGGSVVLSEEKWNQGYCSLCPRNRPSSLCTHACNVLGIDETAALVLFDLRAGEAPERVVGFESMPHKGLYPRMQVVRDNYVIASHAEAPCVIWDRRNLGQGPVASPDLNFNESVCEEVTCDREIFIRGEMETNSKALFLSCCGNVLAGRADNGEVGVWDLTRIIGWSADECRWGNRVVYGPKNSKMYRDQGKREDRSSEIVPDLKITLPSARVSNRLQSRSQGVWVGPDWLAASCQRNFRVFRLRRSKLDDN